jgi:hypothetical protein
MERLHTRLTKTRLTVTVVALYLGLWAALQAGAQAPATAPAQLGQVHSPVSCPGEAQAKFHRAMALEWSKYSNVSFQHRFSSETHLKGS